MALARIDGTSITEVRHDISLDDVPEHKRKIWKTIEGDAPSHDQRVETLSGPVLQIEQNRVLRVWTIKPRPRDEVLAQVRAEAQRRIIAMMAARDFEHCILKQLNANMRANELNDKRTSGYTLTAEEEAEAALLRAMAAAIKAVREASNILEAMETIPSDFDADSRWPQ
jgi:hypothetical protein